MPIDNDIPQDVKNDLNSGFILTDPDNGYQRCKPMGSSVFHYKSGTEADNDEVSATINVSELTEAQKEYAVENYYGSLQSLHDEMDDELESINMIIAECYFEVHHEQPVHPC